MGKELHQSCRGVKHHLPNRTRLKLPVKHSRKATIEKIEHGLRKIPAVRDVETNHKTGSILVHHDESPSIISDFSKVLNKFAVEALEDMMLPKHLDAEDVSIISSIISRSVKRANRGFITYTNNHVDLRTLFPMVLFTIGVSKSLQVERWWTQVPPYMFFYWAYDAYLRFHLNRVPERKENGAASLN
ncbi:MAG: hypothetical protein K2Z81_19675 [Cyanobacteria bacterium]|nr:hypothetical protein [Cyanobacteriota bacterium]